MNPLARFERIVEGLVEGGLSSRLKAGLQPAELAKKLEREMDAGQRIAADGQTVVPNHYEVHLHPDDFAAFEPYRRSVEQELAVFAQQEAFDRGFALRPRAFVELVADDAAPRRRGAVVADFVDPAHLARDVPDGATARIVLDDGAGTPSAITLTFQDPDGQAHSIDVPRLPYTIGRALHNDLPLEDRRVSREHAQILMQQRRVAIVDNGSTHGTTVNGRPVERALLSDNDVIALGGYQLRINIA